MEKPEFKKLFVLIFKIISADNDKLVENACRFTPYFYNTGRLLHKL
jgi:hypothetical protein